MASTIRHNRARGTHQIIDMSNIVLTLTQNGWSEKEISKHLEMFSSHTFSKSWEEFEDSMKKKA